MSDPRKIIINLLPQSEGAWDKIALAVFFLACGWGVNSMAGCAAREAEAKAQTVKIHDNTVIGVK